MIKPLSSIVVHRTLIAVISLFCLSGYVEGESHSGVAHKQPDISRIQLSNKRLKKDLKQMLEDYSNTTTNTEKFITSELNDLLSQDVSLISGGNLEKIRKAIRLHKKNSKAQNVLFADRLLIALGDKESITNAVRGLDAESRSKRGKCKSDLRNSAQPEIITALEQQLFREENSQIKRLGEDVFVSPVSVDAARIILDVVSSCSQFPDTVTEWAESLRLSRGSKSRELVRKWWLSNEKALRESRYGDVVVPDDIGKRKTKEK